MLPVNTGTSTMTLDQAGGNCTKYPDPRSCSFPLGQEVCCCKAWSWCCPEGSVEVSSLALWRSPSLQEEFHPPLLDRTGCSGRRSDLTQPGSLTAPPSPIFFNDAHVTVQRDTSEMQGKGCRQQIIMPGHEQVTKGTHAPRSSLQAGLSAIKAAHAPHVHFAAVGAGWHRDNPTPHSPTLCICETVWGLTLPLPSI